MLIGLLRRAGRHVSRAFRQRLQGLLHSDDLDQLAIRYGSDKRDDHFYTSHYQKHFAHLRKQKLNILEIGVGGYKDPHVGGTSLRMWKACFPNSTIHGLDLYNKSALEEDRIRIYKGSQFDRDSLLDTYRKMGSVDIVIDDGSHFSEHVIFSFKVLFPLLSENGIYVIEDTQTSYWKFAGGDSEDLRNPSTLMNFFKDLADGLNYQEVPRQGYQPTVFDQTVVGVHFYHNLIFIQKGRNDERSNKADFVARLTAESVQLLRES
jgi:hypothetical protein